MTRTSCFWISARSSSLMSGHESNVYDYCFRGLKLPLFIFRDPTSSRFNIDSAILTVCYSIMADHEKSPEDLDVSHIRRNGFGCPWHPLQLAAWFFILLIITFHYGFMVFYIPGNWRVFGYIIPGFLLLVHVITTIVTSSIDPAERSVRLKTHSASRLRPRFDRSKHEHVIENYYCNLCCACLSCNATLRLFGAPIPDPVFPTLTAALGVFSLAGVLLIGHLTLFHFHLIYKGLTTYEYFQLQPAKPKSHDRRAVALCCSQ
eukprot:Em1343g1a